jgi:biopolymer transport protein ExbD
MSPADVDEQEITGINVTPLVDIVLVLLIIFMVTANFVVRETIEVDLPSAASATNVPPTPPLMVTLGPDGVVFLDGVPLDEPTLRSRLAEAVVKDRDVRAVIAADQSLDYARVVRLIDLVKAAGVGKFALNLYRTR